MNCIVTNVFRQCHESLLQSPPDRSTGRHQKAAPYDRTSLFSRSVKKVALPVGGIVKKHLALVFGGLSLLGGCGGGSRALPPTPPTLVLAPASLSFGVVIVGTTSGPQVETLTNPGGSELVINSVTITGTNTTDFDQSSTCGSSLGAGASCTINVAFTPSQLGPRSASITITDDAVAGSQSLSLAGVGGDPGPNATLSADQPGVWQPGDRHNQRGADYHAEQLRHNDNQHLRYHREH